MPLCVNLAWPEDRAALYAAPNLLNSLRTFFFASSVIADLGVSLGPASSPANLIPGCIALLTIARIIADISDDV